MAAARGLAIVPHSWKTGVTVAATAHLAFNTPHCPFIEYLPPTLCTETLRRELAIDGFEFRKGVIEKPTKPGLGAQLNLDALRSYRVA
jgi:L-alanine-DL-glutamate epimerase-like enolase superfamily enzyme